MAVVDVGSSSFEFYEGLRVAVPGGIAVGVYAAVATTFGFTSGDLAGDALAAVLAALLIGFLLLFLDVPARAAVFSFEAPLPFIQSWQGIKPHGNVSYLNVYYEILDEKVPPGIRNRTYYLGVIYRIGFETLYFAALSLPVLLVAVLFPRVGDARYDTSETTLRRLFAGALVVHVAVVASAFWARYTEHRRKDAPDAPRTRRARWGSVMHDVTREIPELDRALLVGSATAIALNLIFAWPWTGVVGVGMPAIVWAIRYFRGVSISEGAALEHARRKNGRPKRLWTNPLWWLADRWARTRRYFRPRSRPPARQNLHAVSAATMFGFASISLCVLGAVDAERGSPLNSAGATAWLVVSVLAAVLIAARSHERKLTGSYGTIRSWFDRNREDLIRERYFVNPDAVLSESGPPEPTT
jgi:hypothetical protein